MSAVEALGQQFAMPRHVRVEAGDVVDTHDPRSCAGRCDEVSEKVQMETGSSGLRPYPGRMRMLHPDPLKEHVVVVHKGHVIDHTLRQFEPDAAVPHIEPIKAYMKRRGYTSAMRD